MPKIDRPDFIFVFVQDVITLKASLKPDQPKVSFKSQIDLS